MLVLLHLLFVYEWYKKTGLLPTKYYFNLHEGEQKAVTDVTFLIV